eukprot:4821467-Amphidinium_carterae.1
MKLSSRGESATEASQLRLLNKSSASKIVVYILHTCQQLPQVCDRPRCDEECKKVLDCGHMCRGVCGEPCPKCIECHVEKGEKCPISLEPLDQLDRVYQTQTHKHTPPCVYIVPAGVRACLRLGYAGQVHGHVQWGWRGRAPGHPSSGLPDMPSASARGATLQRAGPQCCKYISTHP